MLPPAWLRLASRRPGPTLIEAKTSHAAS